MRSSDWSSDVCSSDLEEQGSHEGLGWIAGTVRALAPADRRAKVPHMGWNDVVPVADHPLIVPGEAYFLHGYAFEGERVLAVTDHDGPVTAAIGRDTMQIGRASCRERVCQDV